MSRPITIFDYIASHEASARQAKRIIEDHGYTVDFRDQPGFVVCLKQFIRYEDQKGKGEEAMAALAMAHPDRELILETAETKRGFDGFAEQGTSNQKPATSHQQPATSNQPPVTSNQQPDYTPILMIGLLASALFLSVAIISKN